MSTKKRDDAKVLTDGGSGTLGGGRAELSARDRELQRKRSMRLPQWIMSLIRRGRACFCPRMRPNNASFRFSLLFLAVAIVYSGYYSYDLPGITSDELKHVIGLSNTQLGMLFSVYAFPNAVMPLVSGTVMSVIGVWRGVLIIGTVIACGITVVSLGVYMQSYFIMLLGRALYGLGGESLFVGCVALQISGSLMPHLRIHEAIDVLATEWFKDYELGLAYGLIQSAGQAGSFTAFYGVPALTHYTGTHTTAYLLAIVLAIVSLLCLFTAHGLEQSVTMSESRGSFSPDDATVLMESGSSSASSTTLSAASTKAALMGDTQSGDSASVLPGASSAGSHDANGNGVDISVNGSASDAVSSEDAESALLLSNDASNPSGSVSSSEPWLRRVGLHHLLTLRTEFYAVLIAIATYSGCYYTFLAFANDYLAVKYGMHAEEAGGLIGIISLSSCVLSPLSGLLLDKRGGRAHAAFAAMLCACTAFGLMGFTSAPLMPCMVLAAVSYAVLPAALYPMIAEVVPEEAFTQVYAIINATVNALLMLSFYSAGALSEVLPSMSAGTHTGALGAPDSTPQPTHAAAAHTSRLMAVHAAARLLQAVAVRPGRAKHAPGNGGGSGGHSHTKHLGHTKRMPTGKHLGHGFRRGEEVTSAAAGSGNAGVRHAAATAVATAVILGSTGGSAAAAAGDAHATELLHPDSYYYVFFIFVGYTAVGAIATGYLSWKSLGRGSLSPASLDSKKHEASGAAAAGASPRASLDGDSGVAAAALRLRERRGIGTDSTSSEEHSTDVGDAS